MHTIINQLRRSFAMRGPLGTLQMCAVNVMDRLNPVTRRQESLRQEADDAFDQSWNVDTGGIFRPGEGDVASGNWIYGIRYQAVDANALFDTLRTLEIAYEDFTFVDFGSGKGRAVLIAAGFPFKKVVGVEYCQQLNQIAQQNLLRHPANARRCDHIELVHADAAQYPLPDSPLVLFFFNPFGRPVMERVAAATASSFRASPRRIIVIYFTPYEADLWLGTGVFRRTKESPAIFDSAASMP